MICFFSRLSYSIFCLSSSSSRISKGGGALVRHYSPGSNVHQNEIGSESLWLYGSLCILWSSFHNPYSIFPLYLFASSLYLCQPIVSLYSTLEDLRSPALAASVISHRHQLCVRRTYSISKAPLAMSTNASTEGETPVTSAPSCEVKLAPSMVFL